MFKILSDQLHADLTGFAGLTSLLSAAAGSVYPVLADETEEESFVVYTLRDNGKVTKDNLNRFDVVIESWSNTYDKAIAIADQVTAAIDDSDNIYSNAGGSPNYYKDNYYVEQKFNILK